MKNLIEYINKHCVRGACTCGRCIDSSPNPKELQPTGHTADVHFFKVALKDEPDVEMLRKLIQEQKGEFNEVNLFDGQEHNYMEIGGWIGDQGLALMLMGMGKLLNLWDLLTPTSMLGESIPDELKAQMAGMGMVSIKAKV